MNSYGMKSNNINLSNFLVKVAALRSENQHGREGILGMETSMLYGWGFCKL